VRQADTHLTGVRTTLATAHAEVAAAKSELADINIDKPAVEDEIGRADADPARELCPPQRRRQSRPPPPPHRHRRPHRMVEHGFLSDLAAHRDFTGTPPPDHWVTPDENADESSF
jgi:hypothetical protein